MALPKIVLTANTKSAESDSGRFVRVWEDEPETFVLLTRRRFSGEIRTKTGGVLMPHSDEDNFKLQNHEVVFRIIRGQFGAQKQTVFMTQEVANFLVPLMATPTLAIDLTDVSVGRSLIDTVTRTLSTNLHLPK